MARGGLRYRGRQAGTDFYVMSFTTPREGRERPRLHEVANANTLGT
jgi:hypothetical protein